MLFMAGPILTVGKQLGGSNWLDGISSVQIEFFLHYEQL